MQNLQNFCKTSNVQEKKTKGVCKSDMQIFLKSCFKVLVPASGNVLKYERVEMFYHREPETRAKFVVIETESGRSLSLTELHLLPLGQCDEMQNNIMDIQNVDEWMCKSRFAHKARPGDCVLSIGNQGRLQVDRIVKVSFEYPSFTILFQD